MSGGTAAIMSQNTAVSLGSLSSFTQPPSGTSVTSSLCTDQPFPLQGLDNHCPESQVRPWVSCAFRTINDQMVCRGGGHRDGGSSEMLAVAVTTSGGAYVGTASQLVPPITTGLCQTASSGAADFSVPGTGTCPGTFANCVPSGTDYDQCIENAKHTWDGVAYIPDGEINGLGVTGDARLSIGGQPPNNSGGGADNSSVGGCGASADAWLHPYKTGDTLYSSCSRGSNCERALHGDWSCSASVGGAGEYQLDWDLTTHHAFFFHTTIASVAQFVEWDVTGKTLTERVASVSRPAGSSDTGAVGAIDQTNRAMLVFMPGSSNHIMKCTLAASYTCTDITSLFSGADGLALLALPDSGTSANFTYMGITWNPDKHVIAIYPNYGNDIWEVDATGAATKIHLGGTTILDSANSGGVLKKLGYSRTRHIYVLVNDSIQPAWAICTKSGGC
jgi:hypothetical protein